MAQILNKKDLGLWAGGTKTLLSSCCSSACCMLAKSILFAQQMKRSEKQWTNFNLRWNDTRDWIYDWRFSNLKWCKKMKNNKFLKKQKENLSGSAQLSLCLCLHLPYVDMNCKSETLGKKLIFSMWLGIHKIIYIIWSIYRGVFWHTWACPH